MLLQQGSDAYGRALEHLLFLELRSYLDYAWSDAQLSYWRSRSLFEVDFVIDDRVAIEVKAKARVHPRDYRGLRALNEELELKRRIVVCNETRPRRDNDGVEILPLEEFFRRLWDGEIS